MNLAELKDFNLSDALYFHKDLNPAIFDGDRMNEEVRQQLLVIASDFIEHLGISDLSVKDITISGSNAAYSYTRHSDIDLHIVVDMNQFKDDDIYRELFDAKKIVYNQQHDIYISDYEVELYVQDADQPHISLGEYSVMYDKWNRLPRKRKANFDQLSTKLKYEKLAKLAEFAYKSNNLEKLKNVWKIIKKYRQAGLDLNGEFGPENLAYKALRNNKIIDKLKNKIDELHSQSLSLPESKNVVKNDIFTESLLKEFAKFKNEDYHPNEKPRGAEFKPTMPKGTVRVDVSDVYDWYKLGQHISDLDGLGKHDFGQGPPSTIFSFGDEDTEHKYIKNLEKTGLTTTDIDPVDPNQPKGIKRQKVDPTYNVSEQLTPTDIHKLADKKQVRWDNDPAFLAKTRQLTGKAHLDDLNQTELSRVKKWLDNLSNKSVAESKGELWRVLEPRNIGGHAARYYVVKGQGKQLKMWRSKLGAGDFIKRSDAEAKAEELNKGVAEAFGPLPKDNQQIRLGRHTVDIERVGLNKNYISFAWNDSRGKEHYEEVPVGDLGSFDDLIERIKDEIRYQERKYTDQGVAEGSGFDQEAGIGIDGKTFWFKIRDLVTLADKYPVTKIDPQQFAKQIAGRDEDPAHSMARAEKADLQYPIIVVKRQNGQLWIADGTHRAHKAILNKLPSINAKIIPIKDMAPFDVEQGVSEELSTTAPNNKFLTKPGLRFYDEVPNEEWLQHAINYVKKKSKDEFGRPSMVEVTGTFNRPVVGSIARLVNIPGARGEQSNVREGDLQAIMKIMRETGKLPLDRNGKEYIPLIGVDYTGQPWVLEGNHRIMAAWNLYTKEHINKWDRMPVEIRYFDGGERIKEGPLYPGKIKQSVAEASGYIPSEKEKNDPRFKTALTVDVKPDSIKRNAKAFNFKVSREGIPPLLRK